MVRQLQAFTGRDFSITTNTIISIIMFIKLIIMLIIMKIIIVIIIILISSSDGEAVASLHREGSNLSAASVRSI